MTLPGDPAEGLAETDFTTIGPIVGKRFPDIRLPNQAGDLIDLHDHRAGRQGIVVFHRSAHW